MQSPEKPQTFLHRLLDLLSRPPLSVRLLEAQLEKANIEIRRLSGILTEAWVARGVISVQGDHREPAPPPQAQRKTYAEIEADLTRQDESDYQAFLVDEANRAARLKEIENFRNPTT